MPLPLIIAGLAAAAIGIGAQADAKETNERAQQRANEAQSLYNASKQSLEQAQSITEKSLVALGTSKKKVLETSVNQFLTAYERIKNIELSESVGLNEIQKFTIDKQDALQLQEMSDIYESTFSSGVAGAATGAVVALAASGSLPIVTGLLSTAGSALAIGEIGMAAGIAGSALSFGAAMTPLSAIAAPVLLFSGISASMKADENLEKANTMYAEAESASEQMKTSEVLCKAIADRADMFDGLLGDLNVMFAQCTALLDGVTKKKMKNNVVDARTFTEDELKLVAVTRSLAGAVKAVIDTPILTADGAISTESQTVYEDTRNKLPAFTEAVNEVKNSNIKAKPVKITSTNLNQGKTTSILNATRNVAAIIVGFFMAAFARGLFIDILPVGLIAFGATALLIMDNHPEAKIFKYEKNLMCISLTAGFSLLFYQRSLSIIFMKHYIIGCIIVGVISLVIAGYASPSKGETTNNFKLTLARFFMSMFFFAIAVLIHAFVLKFLNLSSIFFFIIITIVYAFFALVSAFMFE